MLAGWMDCGQLVELLAGQLLGVLVLMHCMARGCIALLLTGTPHRWLRCIVLLHRAAACVIWFTACDSLLHATRWVGCLLVAKRQLLQERCVLSCYLVFAAGCQAMACIVQQLCSGNRSPGYVPTMQCTVGCTVHVLCTAQPMPDGQQGIHGALVHASGIWHKCVSMQHLWGLCTQAHGLGSLLCYGVLCCATAVLRAVSMATR
jgi:hypothetical protein